MAHRRNPQRLGHRPVAFVTDYAEQTPDSLVIPEDLTTLSDEDLTALAEQAQSAFNDLYGDGSDLTPADLEALTALTEGIEVLQTEQGTRDEAAAERAEAAAALAARVRPSEPETPATAGGDGEVEDEEDEEDDTEDEDDAEASAPEVETESLAAGATPAPRGEVRVNLSGLRSRRPVQPEHTATGTPQSMRDVVFAAPDTGLFHNGQGLDFSDLGAAVDHRLTSFNQSSYERAARAGKHIRQQFGIATIRKPFADGLRIEQGASLDAVDEVFARATDETRLPGGSLVASGGWCAPSETLYDLFEMESRDGLFSLPEVGMPRGGIKFTPGPDFSTLFSEITGFHYTEAQDIAGEYGVDEDGVGNDTEGSKPCYKVDCPDFEEVRLALDGLCITAGLLQRRGFPEVIARTIRGALIAHDHRLAGRKIASLVTGSDAVSMAAGQVGATAPILTAIELQVEHYRNVHRLSRGTSLEAVFPFWVRGAVRADLSRRLGVDLFDVPDSRINKWFTDRGVNPQFVYNWQDLTGDAADLTAYPSEVSFLLYAAGTWVGGGSDVITLDTVYDSVMLGQNDYTALFTEEGYAVAKRGHDSRVVTVPICPDGSTAGGVLIDCDGSAIADAG